MAPVLALGLTGKENVLDMCSAPGGKSLLIIQTNLIGMSAFDFTKLELFYSFTSFVLSPDDCMCQTVSLGFFLFVQFLKKRIILRCVYVCLSLLFYFIFIFWN